MQKLILISAAILLLFPGFANAQRDLDSAAFNRDVRAQDDLYQHVNGTWLENTNIPEDKGDFGTFTKLADDAQKQIRVMIEKLSEGTHEKGTDAQKVGDFYLSFMNTQAIEAAGLSPLEDELNAVEAIDSKEAMVEHMGYLQTTNAGTPFGFFVSQDAKDSTRYQVQLIQSGTSLPDRDYYLKDDDKSVAARKAFKDYIIKVLELKPESDLADKLVELETKLAKAQWPRTKLRQATERYNKHTLEELAKLTPEIPWPKFFAKTETKSFSDVNVMTPSFFVDLQQIIADTPLDTCLLYTSPSPRD